MAADHPTARPETAGLFLELLRIVARLRGPDGCPWDREQTPETIVPYLIEEAYEVREAVERRDDGELCEELGDVLLEVVLLSQMAEEQGRFTVGDALRSICDKLVRRHPHVFGEASCADTEEVRRSWAQIKAAEKRGRGALEGVPRRLPALHRARRVSEKASGVGFDWEDASEVLGKVEEELAELRQAMAARMADEAEEELGDVLFALVNLGRHLRVDAEAALHRTTEKVLGRFARVEEALAQRGRRPSESTLEELEALWQEAKTSTHPQLPRQESGDQGGITQSQKPSRHDVKDDPPEHH